MGGKMKRKGEKKGEETARLSLFLLLNRGEYAAIPI